MAHEVQVFVPPLQPMHPDAHQVAQRDDLFQHSAFVRGARHAVDTRHVTRHTSHVTRHTSLVALATPHRACRAHLQAMATVSQDPKMSWTNAAIGLLITQSGWAGDAARDERSEAVVRGVIVGGGCQLA